MDTLTFPLTAARAARVLENARPLRAGAVAGVPSSFLLNTSPIRIRAGR